MSDLSLEARWFKSVKLARDHHNKTCSLGPAIEVHMNDFDIRKIEWVEGDDVCGLLLVANPTVQPDKLRIFCAGDKEAGLGGQRLAVALPQPDIIVVPDFYTPAERELAPVAHKH